MTSAHYPSQIPIMSLGKKSPTNLISQHKEINRDKDREEVGSKSERRERSRDNRDIDGEGGERETEK